MKDNRPRRNDTPSNERRRDQNTYTANFAASGKWLQSSNMINGTLFQQL